MIHKFVHKEDYRQEVHNIAVARCKTPQGTIPVVATAELEQLTLFWWDTRATEWKPFSLPHVGFQMPQPHDQDPTLWNWSRQIQIVTLDSTVLLVAKRQREGQPKSELLIYRFTWDTESSEMVQDSNSPYVVPRDMADRNSSDSVTIKRTGDEIWAGYDGASSQLLVLTQTVPRGQYHCLALLAADLSNGSASLDNSDIWSFSEVGTGGYDSEAIMSNAQLHVVYRESPYAIAFDLHYEFSRQRTSVDLPPIEIQGNIGLTESGEPADLGELDSQYQPLTYKVFSLPDLTLVSQAAPIPGGEHPRIQNVEPLYLSYSRIWRGTIDITARTVEIEDPSRADTPSFEATIKPHVEFISTILLRYDPTPGVWLRGRAQTHFYMARLPRHVYFDPDGLNVFLVNLEGSTNLQQFSYQGQLKMTTRHEFYPVWMTADSPISTQIDDKKVDLVDLLYHNYYYGTLQLKTLMVSRPPVQPPYHQRLDIVSKEEAHLDVNHSLIRPRPHPSTWRENDQFAPFTHNQPWYCLPRNNNLRVCIERGTTFDNTIGTALVMDRNSPNLSFYAYTDAGDGGLRVIFSDDGLHPEQRPVNETKKFNPNAVPGPGLPLAEERWVKIYDSEDPNLPAKNPDIDRTVPNSLHLGLDRLLILYPVVGPVASAQPRPNMYYEIDASKAEDMEKNAKTLSLLELSLLGSDPVSSQSSSGLIASWHTKPGMDAIFVGDTVTFDASGSDEPDPSFTIQQYQWDFGDGQTATGKKVTHAFAALPNEPFPLKRTVRLTVITDNPNPSLNSQIAEEDIFVQDRIFNTLFKPVKLINETMPSGTILEIEFGDSDIEFSRYSFGFRHTNDGARDRVLVSILEKHGEFWRFEASARALGQGRIQYGFRMKLSSENVITGGLLGTVLEADKVEAIWDYGRPFTPAVTMSDQRHWNPFSGRVQEETLESNKPSALTTKPIDKAWTRAVSVDLEMSPKGKAGWLFVGAVVYVLEMLLLFALLGAMGVWILAAGIIGFAALMWFIYKVVFAVLKAIAKYEIRKSLDSEHDRRLRDSLDDSGILTYAGEGLAEVIAVKALELRNQSVEEDAQIQHPPEPWGTVRHIPHIWQQIFVTNGECRVLVR